MKRRTNRKPMRAGAVLLKEIPYKRAGVKVVRDEWRIEATWQEGGKRKKKWLLNWRAAEQFADEQNKTLQATKGKGALSFNDAVDAWLKQQEQRTRSKTPDLSPGVLTTRRIFAGQLQKRFGRVLLHKMEVSDFEDWLLEQSVQNKRATLQAKANVAFWILEYARKRKMVEVNPLKGEKLQYPGENAKKRIEIPDHSDMDKLREYIVGEPGRPAPRPFKANRLQWSSMRVAIVLAATCGMRTGEICGLRWDRITREQEMAEVCVKEVIAERPTRLKDRPKTPAGERKVPLTLEVREILNEHAALYAQEFGKCVGHVVRFDRSLRGLPFTAPTALAQAFRRIMQGASIVKANGAQKFSFHALRHYAASCWVAHNSTVNGLAQVSRWLGHASTQITLDIYTHSIYDPEVHARFLRMPNWLTRDRALPAPIQPALPAQSEINGAGGGESAAFIPEIECPIAVLEKAPQWLREFICDLWQHGQVNRALLALGKGRDTLGYALKYLPGVATISDLEVMASEAIRERTGEAVALPACPIDVPALTPAWLRSFISLISNGLTAEAACNQIRKPQTTVRAELAQLKIAPSIAELARRLRHKRIMGLYAAGYQNAEIARLAGVHVGTVAALRRELQVSAPRGGRVGPAAHKKPAYKQSKGLEKSKPASEALGRNGDKNQLKLL